MIILAIDLGRVRTGIAISDKNEVLASPVCTINERDPQRLLERILEIVLQRGVEKIILGLPLNMNGSEGESAQIAREFAEILENQAKIPVIMQDERGTTITAYDYLNDTNTYGKKRKKVVDSVAATIILQNYLDMS